MEDEYTGPSEEPLGFDDALATLGNSALRIRFPKESRAHARIKASVKEGGFALDPAWDSFRSFLRDMGPAPSPEHSVDRRDNDDRTYGPGRCRWADKLTQTRNRSNTLWVKWQGQRLTLAEFAAQINLPYSTVHSAHQRGEPPQFIAKRATDRNQAHGGDGFYVPEWVEECDIDGWKSRYQVWRRKVLRPNLHLATPELYAALVTSLYYDNSIKVSERSGFAEMTAEDYEASRHTSIPFWIRMHTYGADWVLAALRALYKKEPDLAMALARGRNRDVHHYNEVMKPKSPETR